MAGRAYEPRLLFMWPNAKISVMGGEQASSVLVQIKKDQLEKSGEEISEDELKKIEDKVKAKYEHEGSAYYSTSRLWDDGIIDPVDTRKIIAMGISSSLNKSYEDTKYGVFRM